MFELVKGTQAASLYIAPGADDYAGLSHVAEKLQQDIKLVTGDTGNYKNFIERISDYSGTIGKNP